MVKNKEKKQLVLIYRRILKYMKKQRKIYFFKKIKQTKASEASPIPDQAMKHV